MRSPSTTDDFNLLAGTGTTRTQPVVRAMAVVTLVFLASSVLQAADKTWNGGGADDNWATTANWEGGVAPVDNADALIFAGANRLINTNTLTADWRFSSLTFATNAGAFVLNGNRIKAMASPTVFTNINNSINTQTINLPVNLTNRPSLWNTYAGDIIMNGAITSTVAAAAINSTLVKDGLGTLTLRGANDFSAATPGLKVLNGTLVLDLNAGATVSTTTLLEFGYSVASPGEAQYVKQGGTLLVRGKSVGTSSQTFSGLTAYDLAGLVRIVVAPNGGSGTTLTLGNTWTDTGTYVAQPSYLYFDLSDPNATVLSVPSLANGLVVLGTSACTITDPVKTGFATTNDAGQIVRNTVLANWTGTGSTSNFRTSGTTNFSPSITVGTLTIQGGGSVTGGSPIAGAAFLMEEGVSDYTIDAFGFGGGVTLNVAIHQYSTNGNLIINAPVSCILHKIGPGTLIIGPKNTTAASTLLAKGGLLDLRCMVSNATAKARVYNGGRLQGSGTFGIGNITNTVYVLPGGTLVGTRAATNALTINGYLNLMDKSSIAVDLANTAFNPLRITGTVTNLGANLALSLGYTPGGNDELTILSSDAGITGTFDTVNGTKLGADGRFTLTNAASLTYQFKLLSTSTSVAVQAISPQGTLIMTR